MECYEIKTDKAHFNKKVCQIRILTMTKINKAICLKNFFSETVAGRFECASATVRRLNEALLLREVLTSD